MGKASSKVRHRHDLETNSKSELEAAENENINNGYKKKSNGNTIEPTALTNKVEQTRTTRSSRLNASEANRNKQLQIPTGINTPKSNFRRRLSGNQMRDFAADATSSADDTEVVNNADAKYESTAAAKRYAHGKDLDYEVQKDIQMANELALLRRAQAAWSKGDDIPLILDCENKITQCNPKAIVHKSKSYRTKFEEDKEVMMLRKKLKEAEILKSASVSSEDYRILRQQLSTAFQPNFVS
mmetsp:Transcript_12722/g.15792  ORF Transcript_12722/g.15792 Transcript_12722/m.15792 type:complete len:241 (-) Transcript_12722:94-816(-)|eukprot:CAMPEP_0204833972 /NCGR_PEP_ID=MMETSP1346-20131115/18452_1 /ASSEMBLY_ACC=CAM_ASM_000771 /TAXON_ID=215587 /ORGANISM="Aplanochytrium stocchinoi, Strain GSBS06" /LENGTH=240 /DNA_ID=CAMNT_0051966937 /DNA_START=208 /DNA_END=930 /DNA_ORIENTATION=-